MKVFVTGASGHVASFLLPELVASGHTVAGLSRSPSSDDKIASIGSRVVRGAITDYAVLEREAGNADVCIHLAFDFMAAMSGEGGPQTVCANDRQAIATMCEAMISSASGPTGKTIIIASGTLGIMGTDETAKAADNPAWPRGLSEDHTHSFGDKGLRTFVVRLAPVCYGPNVQHPFVNDQITAAKKLGYAAYIGDGSQVWPSTHVKDVAHLIALALDPAVTPGQTLHAVHENGIPLRDIANKIAGKLALETRSIDPQLNQDVLAQYGFTGMVMAMNNHVENAKTRERTKWEPQGPGLLEAMESWTY